VWWRPSGFNRRAKPDKSHGMSLVPDESTGRRNAGRWSPAHPNRQARSRTLRLSRQSSHVCRCSPWSICWRYAGNRFRYCSTEAPHCSCAEEIVFQRPRRPRSTAGCDRGAHSGNARPSGESPRASRGIAGSIAIIVESPIGRVHRVSSSDPIQNSNMFPSRYQTGHFRSVCGDSTKMPCDRGRIIHALRTSRARFVACGHRFQRREGLRGDDTERLRGVEVAGRFRDVGSVNI